MHLNPYGTDAVLLAVDLVTDPPGSPAELGRRCRAGGLVVESEPDETDLAACRALLAEWTAIVDAADPYERARLLNRLLANATSHPRLTDHAGGWHLHYRADDLPLGRVLRALVATGTALHLVGRGMDRLGRCAVDGCDRIFADVSRNGRQRYCSPRCASRDAVRRHRERRATTGAPA